MEHLKMRREFKKGRKNTTTYIVNGVALDRLDMIYHVLAWARDNAKMHYPKEKFLEFLRFIADEGYKRNCDVTIMEAKAIAEACEQLWFHKTRKLPTNWQHKKL